MEFIFAVEMFPRRKRLAAPIGASLVGLVGVE
jgi:hypothetical protein